MLAMDLCLTSLTASCSGRGSQDAQCRIPLPRRPVRPARSLSTVTRAEGSEDRDSITEKPSTRSILDAPAPGEARAAVEQWLYPDQSELAGDFEMPIWDHLEELRERVLVAALAAGVAILTCFAFSKDLVVFLEAPVAAQGVRFLQLSPGEFFFTTLKVGGYTGLLLAAPTVIYEIIAYVVPGLTKSERQFLAPVVFGSSILFYVGSVPCIYHEHSACMSLNLRCS